ncbi:hypothetical protein [Paraburkholderia flagellata]|uniref:hypothetical protein n=1 Tax=Paraburkholderia flagellata TaxID=2883241 RepID=UPI001F38E775|nr:hypothetical protein [Paraburkholderia flagellata]
MRDATYDDKMVGMRLQALDDPERPIDVDLERYDGIPAGQLHRAQPFRRDAGDQNGRPGPDVGTVLQREGRGPITDRDDKVDMLTSILFAHQREKFGSQVLVVETESVNRIQKDFGALRREVVEYAAHGANLHERGRLDGVRAAEQDDARRLGRDGARRREHQQ